MAHDIKPASGSKGPERRVVMDRPNVLNRINERITGEQRNRAICAIVRVGAVDHSPLVALGHVTSILKRVSRCQRVSGIRACRNAG